MGARRRIIEISLIVFGVIVSIAIALTIDWMISCEERASPSPAGQLQVKEDGDGFPFVDWAYWESVNPDIVAWVTVPDTNIDHPIVQAKSSDPTYYLSHDIYRKFNPMGVPYLDSECAEGMDSPNALVFGHHWNESQIFADFSKFINKKYAEDHQPILLQTPKWKRKMKTLSVELTNGDALTKVVQFDGPDDFKAWLLERYNASETRFAGRLSSERLPENIVTFCTCSYGQNNERTLVYTSKSPE